VYYKCGYFARVVYDDEVYTQKRIKNDSPHTSHPRLSLYTDKNVLDSLEKKFTSVYTL
jgi:hypothetical protein